MSPAGRWTPVADAVVVAPRISGLLVAPSAPASTGPAAPLHNFYATHSSAIVVQARLVHGVAAIALAVLAPALPLTGAGAR